MVTNLCVKLGDRALQNPDIIEKAESSFKFANVIANQGVFELKCEK